MDHLFTPLTLQMLLLTIITVLLGALLPTLIQPWKMSKGTQAALEQHLRFKYKLDMSKGVVLELPPLRQHIVLSLDN